MEILHHYSLKDRNTFGMDVSCACFVGYESEEELAGFFSSGKQSGLPKPFLHIGAGSNLLFTGDFPGTVFHSGIRYIRELPGQDGRVPVVVGAGTLWDDVCKWCAEKGLWGPENLSGIPGEAGAAAVQNIGAYGVEFQDIVREIRCLDVVTSSIKTIRKEDCRYGYRDSMFKQGAKGRYIVTSVVLELSRVAGPRLEYGHVRAAVEKASADVPETGISPLSVRNVILEIRNSKLPDPAVTGNAGSFFKNPVVPRSVYAKVENYALSKYGPDYNMPHFDAGSGFVKIPAAWLIENCGWKGYREGNVGVYERQPLVLVNLTGKASPEEIIALEKKITASVSDIFGIVLEPEVEHIGPEKQIL